MQEGRIVERNAVDSLFISPAEQYTQDLLLASRRVELEAV
jgi:ABC-type dipeptide/oligopeptide/nickel transport system ATPase component